MKRMIYGIGFFLALLFLGAGFFLSYQVADLRGKAAGIRPGLFKRSGAGF